MKLQKDLREFIELLNSHKVDYLIVGGHAVAFHGHPRYTGDIDFLVRPTEENASRIVAAIKEFGFSDAESLKLSFVEQNKVIQIGRPPNRIDILTSASGIEFEEAWARSVEGAIDGVQVRFPDIEMLIKNKSASGRRKDLADVEELEKLRRPAREQ